LIGHVIGDIFEKIAFLYLVKMYEMDAVLDFNSEFNDIRVFDKDLKFDVLFEEELRNRPEIPVLVEVKSRENAIHGLNKSYLENKLIKCIEKYQSQKVLIAYCPYMENDILNAEIYLFSIMDALSNNYNELNQIRLNKFVKDSGCPRIRRLSSITRKSEDFFDFPDIKRLEGYNI
jgi:hypothetical protein